MGCCGSSPQIPDAPDPYTDYLKGYEAQITTYPQQRAIDAAAKTGGKVVVDGVTYDYTGKGDADYQAAYAEKMAASMLGLQQKYGAQYVEQRLKELEQSDPEGMAMRRQLWQDIQGDIGKVNEDRKLAEANQAAILAELEKGAALDPQMQREVTQATKGRQAARGIILGPSTLREETGDLLAAGQQVKSDRQQRALAFLTSGKTPEDIAYQSRQQAMGNLGAFISGQTPTAQFGSLRGAQNGVVPFYGGSPGVGLNQDAGNQSMAYNQSIWNTQANMAGQQANPYLAGMGLGFQGMALGNSLCGDGGGRVEISPTLPSGGNQGTGE
jgi:hypothetical protein